MPVVSAPRIRGAFFINLLFFFNIMYLFLIIFLLVALVVANAFTHAHVINNVMNAKDEHENRGWHIWSVAQTAISFAGAALAWLLAPDMDVLQKGVAIILVVSLYTGIRFVIFVPILNFRRGLPINARGYKVMPFFVRIGLGIVLITMLCGLIIEFSKTL